LLQPDSFWQPKETNADRMLFYDVPQDSTATFMFIRYGGFTAAVRQHNENDLALLDLCK
jgi:hypothetical protein